MTTGRNLTGSRGVQKLQTMLHAKAKEEPERRFHALIDKVWRMDFLMEAWTRVRSNGGSAGVDGETFKTIEAYGVEQWLGELSQTLKDGTYTPNAVRQVLIPKKQPGQFRPLGIPCIRDRVAQTSALLVLEPIFEADLQPEQYAYRPGRSATDAVKRIHTLVNAGTAFGQGIKWRPLRQPRTEASSRPGITDRNRPEPRKPKHNRQRAWPDEMKSGQVPQHLPRDIRCPALFFADRSGLTAGAPLQKAYASSLPMAAPHLRR